MKLNLGSGCVCCQKDWDQTVNLKFKCLYFIWQVHFKKCYLPAPHLSPNHQPTGLPPAGITKLSVLTLTTFYYQDATKRGVGLQAEVLTDSKLHLFYQLDKLEQEYNITELQFFICENGGNGQRIFFIEKTVRLLWQAPPPPSPQWYCHDRCYQVPLSVSISEAQCQGEWLVFPVKLLISHVQRD